MVVARRSSSSRSSARPPDEALAGRHHRHSEPRHPARRRHAHRGRGARSSRASRTSRRKSCARRAAGRDEDQAAQQGAGRSRPKRAWSRSFAGRRAHGRCSVSVGALQLDVLTSRLQAEYGVSVAARNRALRGPPAGSSADKPEMLERLRARAIAQEVSQEDRQGSPVYLARNSWALNSEVQDWPDISFVERARAKLASTLACGETPIAAICMFPV